MGGLGIRAHGRANPSYPCQVVCFMSQSCLSAAVIHTLIIDSVI